MNPKSNTTISPNPHRQWHTLIKFGQWGRQNTQSTMFDHCYSSKTLPYPVSLPSNLFHLFQPSNSVFFHSKKNMFHVHTSMASNISPWASTKTAISSNICALLHCGNNNVGSFHQIHYWLGSNHLPSEQTCPYPTHQETYVFHLRNPPDWRLMLDWLFIPRRVAQPYDHSEAKTKSAMLCSKRKMS